MSKCPYTFVRNLFGGDRPRGHPAVAEHLMVRVVRDGDEKVLVSLPAHGARRLLDLIPDDVLARIRAEEIPIDGMMAELREAEQLHPRAIFSLREPTREVQVWLE